MEAPSVPLAVWALAAFDPIMIVIAVALGWRADQFGKVFLAAIVALALSVLSAWLITLAGLPWVAPVGRDLPTLYPVRTVAAFVWALLGFAARRLARP